MSYVPADPVFFDQDCHDPFLYDEREKVWGWAWVTPEGAGAVGALTVIPRPKMPEHLGSFDARARIEFIGAIRSNVAESLLKAAISYFESRGMKLYRRGLASEAGLKLMKKMNVLVDPAVVFEHARTCRIEPDYTGQDRWGTAYSTTEAKETRGKVLAGATELLRRRRADEL